MKIIFELFICRLSRLWQYQEHERVDPHEDLCNPYRPSKILEMLRALYNSQYLRLSLKIDDATPHAFLKIDEATVHALLLDIIEVRFS